MKTKEVSIEKKPSDFKTKMKKFGNKALDGSRKVASNRYFGSIMEGFMFVMPVIIVSSIFMLMSEIAPAFGYKAVDADGNVLNQAFLDYQKFCMWAYNFSYGLMGLLLAIGVSTKLMEKLNTDLPVEKRVNVVAVGVASVVAYFTISFGSEMWSFVPVIGDNGESSDFWSILGNAVGVKGMFPAILVSFVVPNIYKYCYKFNVTIKLPKQVPGTIASAFLNIFPLLFTLFIFTPFGFMFAFFLGDSFLNAFFNWIAPALKGANSVGFLLGYTALFSFVWFIGIHPSVLSAIHEPLKALGLQENQQAIIDGLRPTNVWGDSLWTSITQPGGTGATIAIPLLIILFAKSKQLKAIGWTALVPVLFQVNEPVLFGVPLVLNPIMFLPFIIIPVLTTGLGIIFVDLFGMPASTVALPWSMPQILSTPASNMFDWRGFVLEIAIFATSFICWWPFIKIQDNVYYKAELADNSNDIFVDYRSGVQALTDKIFHKEKSKEIKAKVIEAKKQEALLNEQANKQTIKKIRQDKQKHILVVCVGAGSSAMLANSINEGAKKTNHENVLHATSSSVGEYSRFIEDMDLVIVSPQARTSYDAIKKIAIQHDIEVYQTQRDEYIDLTKNNVKAFEVSVKALKLDEVTNDETTISE